MNLIVICMDSLRQDHVGFYHGGRRAFDAIGACATPNLDRFAARTLAFRNAYPSNLPTIPIRHELMTGHWGLGSRPWQPLLAEDTTVAEILRREGYTSALVSDTYHYRAPGMNFHRGFHAYEWIRGNEYDPWRSAPTHRRVEDYVNAAYGPEWRARIGQYLANTDDFGRERPGDWFAAQVADRAAAWLAANRAQRRIFLWVDSFDPHEPWDPPAPFDTYRPTDYTGPRLVMPMGGQASDWATAAQVEQIRGLYAGEAASVDAAFGGIVDALERHGYFEDSVILVLADHGHPLGDHGKFLKGSDRMYSELLKVPFFLYVPRGRGNGRVTDAVVQYPDVLPTLLDLLGLRAYTQGMSGQSFRGVVDQEASGHRSAAVSGYFRAVDRCVRDTRWSYVRRPRGEPDELYDLAADPGERHNAIDAHPEEAVRLAASVSPLFFPGPLRRIQGIQGQYEMASGAVE